MMDLVLDQENQANRTTGCRTKRWDTKPDIQIYL